MAECSGTEVLGPDECLELLASQALGRVVFTHQTIPVVQPVAFALDGVHITVAASQGPMLAAAFRGSVVAFQADRINVHNRSGWSVHAVGQSHVVTDADEASRLAALGLPFWGNRTEARRFVRVRLEVVEGHRLVPTPANPSARTSELA